MSTEIRTALVDAGGAVVNVVVVDASASWEAPDGLTGYQLADDSPVGRGWTHNGTDFVPPAAEPAGPILPTVTDLQSQVDALILSLLG